MIALFDDFFRHEIRGALSLCAIDLARIETIHALLVHRIYVRHFLLEGLNVDKRNDDDCAGNLGWVQHPDQLFKRNDRSVFRTVRTGDEGQHRTWPGAINDSDRNAQTSVDSRRHLDRARDFLTGRRGGCADDKWFSILTR